MHTKTRLPIISRGANDARRVLREGATGPYGYIHPALRRPGVWILDMRDAHDETTLYLATTTRAAAEAVATHHGAQFLVEDI